eukprot:6111898-Prymnesium_polylepis.1
MIFGRPMWRAWDLHAGDYETGDYYYYFRNVQANKEGGGTSGGSAIFSSVLDDTITADESAPSKKEGVELKRAIELLNQVNQGAAWVADAPSPAPAPDADGSQSVAEVIQSEMSQRQALKKIKSTKFGSQALNDALDLAAEAVKQAEDEASFGMNEVMVVQPANKKKR